MHVVITRPASDAPSWVEALQAAGHKALALALIDVAPATDAQPVAAAWAQWPNYTAVMFVSAQAVRYFFQHPSAQASLVNAAPAPRCWATGPGTHKALRQAGVPEACIDSPGADADQFDSEALWQRVAPQVRAGQKVLIVRGQDEPSLSAAPTGTGRDWLAQQLQAAGASAQFVVAYTRRPPLWTPAQKAAAIQAASNGSVWCISSSQALLHLAALLPGQDWQAASCLATHPRIAHTAQQLGFGQVHLTRPHLADVIASLESLA